MEANPQFRLVPLAAMARRLHVTKAWLRTEAEANRIPHLHAGDRLLFDPVAVEACLMTRATREVPHE